MTSLIVSLEKKFSSEECISNLALKGHKNNRL